MEKKWVEYNISGWKGALLVFGVILVVGSFAMAITVGVVKDISLTNRIHTYQIQAAQAASPQQFAVALRKLDKALVSEGMTEGLTMPGWASAPHNYMEYKRGQFALLAERAERFGQFALTSTEVNTGLDNVKAALSAIPDSAYGYWMFRQGGVWLQLWMPLILLAAGVGALVAESRMPYYYRRRIPVNAVPA